MSLKELIEHIAKSLVDHPEEVEVYEVGERKTAFRRSCKQKEQKSRSRNSAG